LARIKCCRKAENGRAFPRIILCEIAILSAFQNTTRLSPTKKIVLSFAIYETETCHITFNDRKLAHLMVYFQIHILFSVEYLDGLRKMNGKMKKEELRNVSEVTTSKYVWMVYGKSWKS
jgi:hypothetical protein